METLPEPQDDSQSVFNSLLRLFFSSDEELERYSSLEHALACIKRGELCWQALVSIGLHFSYFSYFAPIRGEDQTYELLPQDLVAEVFELLETMIAFLTSEMELEPLTDEKARVLFHTRFALGSVCWMKDDTKRTWEFWRELAATRLSRVYCGGGEVSFLEGRGIVKYSRDLAAAKWYIAFMWASRYAYPATCDDVSKALYLIRETAVAGRSLLAGQACEFLDRLADMCEKAETSGELDEYFDPDNPYYLRDVGWVDLFALAGEILPLSGGADSSDGLPHEQASDSAQHLAWKFGQLVGRYAMVDKFRQNPLAGFDMLFDYFDDNDSWSGEPVSAARLQEWESILLAAAALVSEYGPERDWVKLREFYIYRWGRSATFGGCAVHEIGPNMDLYWAMRIGLADKILELQRGVVPTEVAVANSNPLVLLQQVKDMVSSMSLRQMKYGQEQEKHWQELDKRLPPEKRKLVRDLAQHLGSTWDELPKKVANALAKAESYYRTKTDDDDAKVWFAKAVETALDDCLVSPLIAYMEEHHLKQLAIPFPAPRGPQNLSTSAVRKLTLGEWEGVLAGLGPQRKDLSSLAAKELREFLNNVLLTGKRWPDLFPLAQGLRRVQKYRGGSAHYQEAATRMEKEEWELEELRKLVLGIGQQSVIELIYRLLGKRNP